MRLLLQTMDSSLLEDSSSSVESHWKSTEEEDVFIMRNVIGAILTICCIAVLAGLFLGLLTLDVLDLHIIIRASNDEDEKQYAASILPIVKQRHRLLVTLLIFNSLAYEALPLFLDAIVPSWAAVLLSVSFVLVFGEIIPSAIFTGPHQLRLASQLNPLTLFLMFISYPIVTPLAKLLDVISQNQSDDEEEYYNRGELSALVRIQSEQRVANKQRRLMQRHPPSTEDMTSWSALKRELLEVASERLPMEEAPLDQQLAPPLHPTEINTIEGALQMKTKMAMDVYTPLRQMYSLPHDLVLDKPAIMNIYSRGYARVPVYQRQPENENDDKTALLGIFLTRQLIVIEWEDLRQVCTLPLLRPRCVSPRTNLVDLLKVFKNGGSRMVFVCARPDLASKAMETRKPLPVEAGFMGILTLEDVMESILQDRIYDESDIRERDRAVALLTRWAAEKVQKFMKHNHQIKKRDSLNGDVETGKYWDDGAPSEKVPLLVDGKSSHYYYLK